jgi:metal-responsive CopG/Arc/MetJ family transcriptional regulator
VKTAVSTPDQIFQAAEGVSKRLGVSRSRLYTLAIEQLIARQQGRGIQEALDEVYATEDSHLDETLATMQTASIRGNRKSW